MAAEMARPAHAQGTPTITIAAGQESAAEGEEAKFVLTRTGDTTNALKVRVFVSEPNHPEKTGPFSPNPTDTHHSVTFDAGSATATLTVPVAFDGVAEAGNDWIMAAVDPESGSPYRIANHSFEATVTIIDSATHPVRVNITAERATVAEGEEAGFTLTRTGDTTDALTVRLAVSDPGFFLRGNHWDPVPASHLERRIDAGADTAKFSLQVRDDRRDVPDGNLTVSVVAGSDYSVGGADSATVTVTDNDVAPEIELVLSADSFVEGEDLILTVRRHRDTANRVDLDVTHGLRGQQTTSHLGFDPGVTAVSLLTVTDDDDLDEADRIYEAAILPLYEDAAAEAEYWTVRGDRTISATVADDDLPLVYVERVRTAYREGDYGALRLVRVGVTARDLDIEYRTRQAGRDVFEQHAYLMGRDRTEAILASSDHVDVFFLLQWDDGDEAEGAIALEIRPSDDYRIDPERSEASFRVIDDDPAPVVTVSGASVSEDSGTVDFTVGLDSEFGSRRTATVDYATADGTAGAPDGDYTETSGTLTFAPGETSATVSVPVIDDAFAEADETLTLIVSNPSNATMPDGADFIVAVGTIEDDEPTILLEARREQVTEGQPVVYTVTRQGNTERELTVPLLIFRVRGDTTVDQHAVTFEPGAAEVEWSVESVDDELDAPDYWIGAMVPDPVEHPAAYHSAADRLVRVDILDDDLPEATVEAVHASREEGQDVEFILTRHGVVSAPLAVNVTVTGGDGYLAGDRPTVAAFAAGAATAPLTLPTEDDSEVDEFDTVTATVASGDGYRVGEPAAADVGLYDSRRPSPEVSIRANAYRVNEGEDVVFTLTRSNSGLDSSLTVDVTLAERRTRFGSDGRYVAAYGSVKTVEFEPGSRTATLTHRTENEAINDGNSTIEAEIRLGGYAIRPYPGKALTWVRDDDIPTVTIEPVNAVHIETEGTNPEFILSRTGDTTHALFVSLDSYGLQWYPGFVRFNSGHVLIDGVRYGADHYFGELHIPAGSERDILLPGGEYERHLNSGESSRVWETYPRFVSALGGYGYITLLPHHCESVPGDCGYRPQYHVGTPKDTVIRVHNNAQGVRVEADRAEMVEGGSATFTLHRYGASDVSRGLPLTVRVQVTQDGDFIEGVPPQTVDFAGYPDEAELTATVTISTADDLLDEADGSVTLTVLPPPEETIGEDTSNYEPTTDAGGDSTWTHQATIQVLDNDVVGFAISDADGNEDAGSVEFTVALPGESALETRVDWATAPGDGDGAATPGEDYEAASGTLTFAPGETSKTVVVAVLDDDTWEEDETFVVVLSNASGAGLSVATAVGTINNDDKRQRVYANGKELEEGEDAVFRLFRYQLLPDRPTPQDEGDVSSRGPLVVGLDFTQDGDCLGTALPATAVFEAGEEETTVTVPTVDDEQYEPTCRIRLTLTADPAVELRLPTKPAEVLDNDMPVSIDDAQADESDGEITFTVRLAEASTNVSFDDPIAVDVVTSDGTATSHGAVSESDRDLGADFVHKRETLEFYEGERERPFTVKLVDDDFDEADIETFTVTLSNPSLARLADATATGTIRDDDDDPPLVRLLGPANAVIDENAQEPPRFEVQTIYVEGGAVASERHISIRWQATPGTATPGEDYRETGGTVVIPAGHAASESFAVAIVDDDLFEEEFETFTVTLTGAENAVLKEDEKSFEISIRDTEQLVAEVEPVAEAVYEGQPASFTVRLSEGESTAPVELSYTTAGTADVGADYIAPSGTLTIPAGQQSGTITINTLPDDTVDPGETLEVELTSGKSVGRDLTVSVASATTTILDGGTVSATVGPEAGETLTTPVEGAVAASEAVEGTEMQFAVTLSESIDVQVTVDWETREFRQDPPQEPAATADIDYQSSSGTMTIAPGEASAKLTVATIEDSISEGNELFEVILTGATRGTDPDNSQDLPLGVVTAVGRILDNDDPPAAATLTATPSTVAEHTGEAELTVTATFDGPNSMAVDTPVSVTVVDGTATEGDDYTATAATLTHLRRPVGRDRRADADAGGRHGCGRQRDGACDRHVGRSWM